MALADRPWPDPARFPVNHAGSHVRQQVWGDLTGSSDPVVIAGFSSIGELIDLAAAWAHRQHEGSLRVAGIRAVRHRAVELRVRRSRVH
jgi:hypothetical protein